MLTGVTMKRLAAIDSWSKNSVSSSNPPLHALPGKFYMSIMHQRTRLGRAEL
jgi:hypothetical protein